MNWVMHITGAAAVAVMGLAALAGIAGERRHPVFGPIAVLALAALSLSVFAVGQYWQAVAG